MNKIRFTKEGFEKLKKEQETLLTQRPAVVEDLKKARELGDLKENGYYQASRQKLNGIDRRLFRIKLQMKQAVVIDAITTDHVTIGSTITLKNDNGEHTYTMVGDLEANPSEGKISLLSPLGRAVDRKTVGENVELETPRGKITYKLTAIK
ncbi:MAG TPA: transcription elongation factor GreA [Patescibacteria group bacterium]|nr:transcription elongation factor GreA [Patescibacteria group bacterium]